MRHPHVPDDPRDMELINGYLEHLRRAGKADSTIDGRREILGRLNRDLPYGLGQTTRRELSGWLYRDGWSRNTKYTYYSCLKDFYAWAAAPADPWISADPTFDLEPVTTSPGIPRPVTDGQLRDIIARAAEPFRTWAIIAAYSGLRCVEISRLDREHVTEQQLIVVRGKGGRPRVHDTDPYVWAAVKDLPAGPVARHPGSGERASAFYVSSESANHFKRKLKINASMHQLRHWLGCTVQREYRDIRVTQKLLGHQSLQSTQVYTDATAQQQREARATLPRLA